MPLTPEQRALRRTRIASTEIGALFGVDPFKSWKSVVRSKLFPQDEEGEDYLQWGHDKEPAILANFARRAALHPLPLPEPGTVIHPRYDWMCATPDFIGQTLWRTRRMVEAKNVAVDNPLLRDWGDAGTDEVPLLIVCQVTVTLAVLLERNLIDDEEADIAPSIMGRVPPVPAYRIRFDPDLFEQFAAKAFELKSTYIDTGTVPELDGSDDATQLLRRRWPTHREDLLPATDEAKALHTELLALEAEEAEATRRAQAVEQKICALIGDAGGIEGVATWRRCRDSTGPEIDWMSVTGELAALGINPHDLRRIVERHTREAVIRPGVRKFLPVRPKKSKSAKPALEIAR